MHRIEKGRLYPTPQTTENNQHQDDTSSSNSNAEVLARLRRLEDIVIGSRPDGAPSEQAATQTSSLPQLPPQGEEHSYISRQDQSSAAAVDWLEGEATCPPSTNLLAYEIEIKTCPIREAAASAAGFYQNASAKKCVWLPLYEESKMVVNKYLTDITYIHHVVHSPSVRAMTDELYRNLSDGKPVKIGHVSLLLGILASSTLLWTEHDSGASPFSTADEANKQSTDWAKVALEVLNYSRRMHLDSLEDVQTMIIVSFVIFNLMGLASQARYLVSTAIAVAKHLCLHRIDHPHNANLDVPSPTSVRAEMGRRVWWYLAATDWQMSVFAGPQKGTYIINPRHMKTRKPINADDEELVDGMIDAGRPIDQPTSISYSLQRIRLGELCRDITDNAPLGVSESQTSNYEQTKEIDTKLCDFANGLPYFFSLDNYGPNEPSELDPRKSTGIIIQRYIINSLLHTQRCRLHLPYLSRASKDPTYAYSRKACLEAARMVIRTEREYSVENIPFVLTRWKFCGVLHCVCMAIIVLLIDFCLNRSHQPEEEQGRQREIHGAFAMLEGQTPFAQKLLESFKTVLYRHNAPVSVVGGTLPTRAGDPNETSSLGFPSGATIPTSSVDTTSGDNPDTFFDPTMPSFDELWKTFDDTVESTNVDWNVFFGELDTPFLSV
ncbi:hypothetical protein FQN54_003990 [Arachnomyces sp. PD_36]|nr:hypothetical protein FQN54_003990 [Arachnomyces sp. PD_36]